MTRTMGLYGTGVDQIVSVNVVTASGRTLQVDQNHHSQFWYAIRGAAPNFGVVTSAVVKAYPTPKDQNIAWEGALTFSDDKLEDLIQAIHDLDLTPQMQIDLLFATSGPPTNKPVIIAIPFFLGNASAGEAAFAPILKIGPTSNGAMELPYNQWGSLADSFCIKGPRKPSYGVSLAREGLNPKTWLAVYNSFKGLIATYPEFAGTNILAEYYNVQKAAALDRSSAASSYPFRDVPLHVIAIPSYVDSSFDAEANTFAAHVRELLRSTDGLVENST